MCNNECLMNLVFTGSHKKSHSAFTYDYTYSCMKHSTVYIPGTQVIRCSNCAEWTFNIAQRLCPKCDDEQRREKIRQGEAKKLQSLELRAKRKQNVIELHPESKQVIGF